MGEHVPPSGVEFRIIFMLKDSMSRVNGQARGMPAAVDVRGTGSPRQRSLALGVNCGCLALLCDLEADQSLQRIEGSRFMDRGSRAPRKEGAH